MLNFCAEHDILPETELINADYINEAYERVLSSDVRYRKGATHNVSDTHHRRRHGSRTGRCR